jgi:large subunit ribosomal protein L37Ae
MAAKEKRLGSVKRFGARYGRTVRFRLGTIEAEQRRKHKCPSCNAERVKRVAVGIWNCRKCGLKFTGKAYSPVKKIVTKAEVSEEKEEIKKEEKVEE